MKYCVFLITLVFVLCWFVCLFKGKDNCGSNSNNIVGGSNSPQHWLPLIIKQEEEEEEEQSVSQRADLLDFIDQDHYKRGMEENQNPEHRTDDPVKKTESDSASGTTDKQVSVHDFVIKPAS